MYRFECIQFSQQHPRRKVLLLVSPILLMRKLGLREIKPLPKVMELLNQTQDVNYHTILSSQLPSKLGHSIRETR